MKLTDEQIAALRDDLTKRLEIKADMLAMGERIAFGSDSAIMRQAADTIHALATEVIESRAEIERLTKERDEAVRLGRSGAYKANPEYTWAEWAADRQKELDAAEARIAELEAALKPFAAMPCGICENDDPAIGVERCSDDTPVYVTRHDHGGQTVAAGHFRTARKALGRDAT
jgi:hypothetical protein